MLPAMLPRRKLCAIGVIAAFFLLMLASHSIHRKHFQPLPFAVFSGLSSPPNQNTVDKPTGLPAGRTHPPTTTMSGTKEVSDGQDVIKPGREIDPRFKLCGCPKSCIADLNGWDWFSQRYSRDQEPVLRETEGFEHEAIYWWLTLQLSSYDTSLKKVLTKLFNIIPRPTINTGPDRSVCRRCAVVGNSGNLRQSGHGELIDSHSFVLRMNKAVTAGFETDVGNRTTHHFMYPESAVDVKPGVSLVLLPFKMRDLEWLVSALSTGKIKMTYTRVKERVVADKDKVLVVNPEFFKYVHDNWTDHHGRYPSTGMLAIIFALHICDEVSVFGFGADQQGNWHHYWEENRYAGAFRKTGVHNADFEMKIIRQLAEAGKISLHL